MKLNDVADSVLKDKKVEYDDIGNITLFAYQDWKRFVAYNVKDALLQYGIENKVNDLLTYYMRSMSNLTPYNKIFKETHLLRNVREIYFEKEGWVQGNNLNTISTGESTSTAAKLFYDTTDDDDEGGNEKASFKGAINADPLMNGHIGMVVLGVKSNNIFYNPMDYDMGAFYPSVKIICNMDASTLLYKASFDNSEFISGECPNKSLNQQYEETDKNGKKRPVDITGEAVNTLCSGNILTFAYNYLGLPTITELYEMVISEMK